MNVPKPQCEVCGRKEGRHEEFGYRIGYFEETLSVGGRSVTYLMCTRCKRMTIKGGPSDSYHFNGFGSEGPKRTVYIPDSSTKGGAPSKDLFDSP